MDYAQIQSDEDSDKMVALVPTDGSDTYYTRERASNFDEVLKVILTPKSFRA